MRWLRVFHWCLVRLERDAGRRGRSSRPSELDAAVFQITLEVRWLVLMLRFDSGLSVAPFLALLAYHVH